MPETAKPESGDNGPAPAPGKPDQNPNDIKTIIGATLGVLAVGGLIFAGLLFALHRGDTSGQSCGGRRQVGLVSGLLDDAKSSPFNGTLGGRCEYFILLRDGQLRAAKAHIHGVSCALDWFEPHKAFRCTNIDVEWSKIEYWPTREIKSGRFQGQFEINFN